MQRLGGSSCKLAGDPATHTRTQGPDKRNKLLAQQERSPWRSKSLLQGLGGYTRRVHSRAPTGTTRTKHNPDGSRYKTESRQSLNDSAHTLPEARGLLSDTIKGDTLSKNRKESLGLAYINAKGRSQGLGRFSDSPEARAATTLRLAEALSPRKASDGLPILRFARGRLGTNLIASVSTDFSDKASRPVNAPNHSRNVSRMTAQYHRVTDETGDRTEQGLPATVLSTAPITGARTAQCYLIPAPGTARRGESSLGHYSLGISI